MKNATRFLSIIFVFVINSLWSQTHTWTGGAGTDMEWTNPANWDAGTVPTASSDVLIPNGFFPEIISQPAVVNSILLEANAQLLVKNNLTFSENLSINTDGTLHFEKGFLQGGGTLVNNGLFYINSSDWKDIKNINIENNSTILVENSSIIHFHTTVVFNNNEGAEINILSGGGFIEDTSDDVTLNNYGTISKLPVPSGGGGAYYLIMDINNHGIMYTAEDQDLLVLVSSQNFNNAEDGILTGMGAFDITANFTNSGKIRPGSETTVGTLEMVNNVNIQNPGVFEIDINSPTENDKIQIFGTPDLQGDITVTLGYGPDLDDEFTILTASNGIGTCQFPVQVSTTFGLDTYTFDVICNPNDITLKVESILLSVNQIDEKSIDFYVYPNPVKGATKIYFDNTKLTNFENQLSIVVYNVLGQKVSNLKNFSEVNNIFNSENLTSGFYFLHLKSEEKLLATTKMIVE